MTLRIISASTFCAALNSSVVPSNISILLLEGNLDVKGAIEKGKKNLNTLGVYILGFCLCISIITASTIRYTRKRVSPFCGTRISTVVSRFTARFPLPVGTEVINVYSGI